MGRILITIPSYDRPEALNITLKRLVDLELVEKIVVIADASSNQILEKYRRTLSSFPAKVVVELSLGRRGSTKARNAALSFVAAAVRGTEYVLIMEDDHIVPSEVMLQIMVKDLDVLEDVGAVGARVIVIQKRQNDPDFSFNVPLKLTYFLSRITGFLFASNHFRIGYQNLTSHFMLIRNNLLDKIAYDENYQGTAYREETDLQMQVRKLGFKIFHDDRAFVYHLPIEAGGNRNLETICRRMYWKSKNHTYFILKWNDRPGAKSFWFLLCSVFLLTLYRPVCLSEILLGLRHGYKLWSCSNACPK